MKPSTGSRSLTVCLLPAWEGGSWLWVWLDVSPAAKLTEDDLARIILATQIEEALRDAYITLVKVRGAEDARDWVSSELTRLRVIAAVIEQSTWN
jgi:hypothetical protein